MEESDSVRLSICAVELVEDVDDQHALVPSNEGWDVGDGEDWWDRSPNALRMQEATEENYSS